MFLFIDLLLLGIKETEPEKYPMKGYLAIREGDILCVSQNSTTAVKHMADLVSKAILRRKKNSNNSYLIIKVCKSIGFTRGAQYGMLLCLKFIEYYLFCYFKLYSILF